MFPSYFDRHQNGVVKKSFKYARLRSVCPGLIGAVILFAGGCKNITSEIPTGTTDPKKYKTEAGAIGLAVNTRFLMASALENFSRYTALMSDELQVVPMDTLSPLLPFLVPGYSYTRARAWDSRALPEIYEGGSGFANYDETGYATLHRLRASAALAQNSLSRYANTPQLQSERSEMLAYQGFAEVFLAEMFCSGVPLSTVDFDGNYTYSPGVSHDEVMRKAVISFDSAIELARSFSRDDIVRLATLGKARAQLSLGSVDAAATLVADVPVDFRFQMPRAVFDSVNQTIPSNASPDFVAPWVSTLQEGAMSLGQNEGGNGLPFVTPRDPRVKYDSVRNLGPVPGGDPFLLVPAFRYRLILATGVEALLVQAEAAAVAGNTARVTSILNSLRTSGSSVSAEGDTTWSAGLGGVSGLRLLSQQSVGTTKDQVLTTVFNERAYWLFYSGRRQGDLRRLVRNYGRRSESVYPTGLYGGGPFSYSTYADAPFTRNEVLNPYKPRCLSRDN